MSRIVISLAWQGQGLDIWEGRGVERALTRAVAKAGGDAIRAMKAEAGRRVRGKKRFKAKRVSRSLPIVFPANKTDLSTLGWRMDVSGEAVPVMEFGARQTRRGVTFGLTAGRQLIKHAFIARMKSGHTGVFRRRLGAGRLKIDEAFTSRISDVFGDPDLVPAVQARTQAVFGAAFQRLMPIELDRLNK